MLLGSFRTLSPLNVTSHTTAQCGDHNRQVEISQSAHVSSHLQQSFGDRGDHVFDEAVREFQSPKPFSTVTFVDHVPEVEMPTSPAGKGSTYLDVELTDKPVQPEIKDSSSDPAANSFNKYESGDTGHTLSDVRTLSQTTQNTVPNSVSSADKRLNWEMLFMPYRRKVDATQIKQLTPVAVDKETRNQTPMNLPTLREGFSETIVTRHYSEGDVIRPDYVDIASVDNTSLWVMLCDILMPTIKLICLDFLCLIFVICAGDVFHLSFFLSNLCTCTLVRFF